MWIDLAAIMLLLALGAALARGGNPFDLRFVRLGSLLGQTAGSAVEAPASIVRATPAALPTPNAETRVRWAAIGRGLFLAVPVVVVMGLLLASADAVFASLLDLSIDISRYPVHLLIVLAGIWFAATFFVRASHESSPDPGRRRVSIGATEGCLVLAALIVVYGLFAYAQLLVALRDADYVLDTTGLTYAEYARSGFFQLLWVAGLTLVVLLGLRGAVVHVSVRSRRVFRSLSLAAVALTLVVVHAAIVRLGLYEDAFGLTMLRLYSTVFAWWIGIVFVLTGVALAGLGHRRQWLVGAVLCSALATLVWINVVNPEQIVVERNVAHLEQSGEFDADYASNLSDDAVPSLVDALPKLRHRGLLLVSLCEQHAGAGPTDWNLSAHRAATALAAVCE